MHVGTLLMPRVESAVHRACVESFRRGLAAPNRIALQLAHTQRKLSHFRNVQKITKKSSGVEQSFHLAPFCRSPARVFFWRANSNKCYTLICLHAEPQRFWTKTQLPVHLLNASSNPFEMNKL